MQIKNELFVATVVDNVVVDVVNDVVVFGVVLFAICSHNGFVVVAVVVDTVVGDVVSVTFNSVGLVVGFRGVIFKVLREFDIPSTDRDFKFSALLSAVSMISTLSTSI